MKRLNLKLSLLLLFIIGGFFVFLIQDFKDTPPSASVSLPLKYFSCFSERCFDVNLADTPEKRQKGLMFVEALPQDQGELFIFDTPSTYAFWMKNTYIPLDIIWISEELKVVHIETQTTPLNETPLRPSAPAKYVLEINAGITNMLKLRVGDPIIIQQDTSPPFPLYSTSSF